MDRKLYILPAIVSLGLHGIVFLGAPEKNDHETRSGTITCGTDTLPPIPKPTEFLLPPPPEKTEDLVSTPMPAPKLGERPPGLEDFIREATGMEFRIEVATNTGEPTTKEIRTIPIIGDPNGKLGSDLISAHIPYVSSVTELDSTPNARIQPAPRYPNEARRDGRDGTVVVDFMVNERGEVIRVSVVHSSDPVFNEATKAAVLRWRFSPGLKNGKAVPFKMRVPIAFTLGNA